MLRGCLLALSFYALLAGGYGYWLDHTFERPAGLIAGCVVGFIVLCCLGALNNARIAWSDWAGIAFARFDVQLTDGKLCTVSGTIHPVGEPLLAPFSRTPCILCEYDLAGVQRLSSTTDDANSGSDYAGFLMTPSVIRTPMGEVRLLGFPIIEGFEEHRCDSYRTAVNAREFLRTTEFEDRTGFKLVSILSVFGDIWADEDGSVQKNIRLGTTSLDQMFPPGLDAAAAEQDDGTDDDEDEDTDDDAAEERFQQDQAADEEALGFSMPLPKLVEKRVPIGVDVCAIGIYSDRLRGLAPPGRSGPPNRLLRGTPDEIEAKSRGKIVSNVIGGIVGLILVHAAVWFAMTVYRHSPEVVRDHRQAAQQAVLKNDSATLANLVRRGFDVNARDAEGHTLLMTALQPEIAAWLIEHGADVNAVDHSGQAALHFAARFGRTEIVRHLIAAKADLNIRYPSNGRTPLGEAIGGGHAETADLLQQAGATE